MPDRVDRVMAFHLLNFSLRQLLMAVALACILVAFAQSTSHGHRFLCLT